MSNDRTNLGNGLAGVWGVWGGAHGIPSRRSVPHYLLAFLAASLLGRRSSAVSGHAARVGDTSSASATGSGETEHIFRKANGRANEIRYRIARSGCWEVSSHRPNHFGHTRVSAGRRGREIYIHRLAYEQAHGPIPEGLLVMHSCDNPRCINPAHLSTGTNGDNFRDSWAKGRCGITVRKLDARRVIEIYLGQEHPKITALRYGVSRVTVIEIRSGRRWSRVTGRIKGTNFAREVSQVETPGAATVAGPSEAKGASPTSHQYDGGSGNLPARKFIFHPAPSPDFRGPFAEAQRGDTTKAAVQIDARPADVNRCGAMEPLSAIQPATQKTH